MFDAKESGLQSPTSLVLMRVGARWTILVVLGLGTCRGMLKLEELISESREPGGLDREHGGRVCPIG